MENGTLRFAAYGIETCPTTQREHLQTYVCFPHAVSLERVRRLFPDQHVEVMQGTLVQNENYCSKQSSLVKLGDEPNEQGKRSDIVRVRDHIEETGERPMKIARTSTDGKIVASVVRHYRFFQEQYSEVSWERRCAEGFKPPKVIIYSGVQGTEKSRRVWEDVGYANAGMHMWKAWDKRGEYFNGYHGQRVAFFEDVQKDSRLPDLATFKDILDGYPVRVNIKFGEPVVFCPEVIYITSNSEWRNWFDYPGPTDVAAIERRITKWVRVFTHGEDEVVIDRENAEEEDVSRRSSTSSDSVCSEDDEEEVQVQEEVSERQEGFRQAREGCDSEDGGDEV